MIPSIECDADYFDKTFHFSNDTFTHTEVEGGKKVIKISN